LLTEDIVLKHDNDKAFGDLNSRVGESLDYMLQIEIYNEHMLPEVYHVEITMFRTTQY